MISDALIINNGYIIIDYINIMEWIFSKHLSLSFLKS